MQSWLGRHGGWLLFGLSLTISAITLVQATNFGLLPLPRQGTDQLAMLLAAVDLYHGKLPPQGYLFSPVYTLFLTGLVALAHGELWWMRLLQAFVCALVPAVIYRLALTIRLPRPAALLAGLLWCFYGPGILLGLDFLREIPVCLAFTFAMELLALAFLRRSRRYGAAAGVLMGLCIAGRENYGLVALAPVLLLLLPEVRRRWPWSHTLWYVGGVLLGVLPFMLLNWFRFGVFATVPTHTSIVYLFTTFHGATASHSPGAAVTALLGHAPEQLYWFLRRYEFDNSLSFYAHREMIPMLGMLPLTYNMLAAAALVGLWHYRRNLGIRTVGLLAAAYVVSFLWFMVYYRFRIHVVPPLCVLAGAGIWSIVKAGSWKQAGGKILFILAVVAVTWDNPDKLRRPAERWAVVHVMLLNRQFDRAEDYIRQLDRAGVPSAPAKTELIRSLLQAGRRSDAARLSEAYRQLH